MQCRYAIHHERPTFLFVVDPSYNYCHYSYARYSPPSTTTRRSRRPARVAQPPADPGTGPVAPARRTGQSKCRFSRKRLLKLSRENLRAGAISLLRGKRAPPPRLPSPPSRSSLLILFLLLFPSFTPRPPPFPTHPRRRGRSRTSGRGLLTVTPGSQQRRSAALEPRSCRDSSR